MERTNISEFKITDNIIRNINMQLHDGGAIYMCGTTGGSNEDRIIISGNYCFNAKYPNSLLYPDEGSNYMTFENNVVDTYEMQRGNWAMCWINTIHFVDFINNYTTTDSFPNEGVNCKEEGTYYSPTADWPEKALDIIANAGLEPEYQAYLGGMDKSDIGKIVVQIPDKMRSGEQVGVSYKVKALGGYDMQPESYRVKIESDNEEVVKAEGDILTAVGMGMANITLTVENRKTTKQITETVTVDDFLEDISMESQNNTLLVGQTRSIEVTGNMHFGDTVTEEVSINCSSLNPQVAEVSADGTITALTEGDFTVRVTAEYDGNTVTKDFPYRVVTLGNSQMLDGYTKYPLSAETKSIAGWYGPDGIIEADSSGINLAGTFVNYKDRVFKDELIEFNMTLKGEISWPTIVLNNKDYSICAISPNTDAYIIVIKAEEIELQRWKNGVGTMIYGEAAGRVTIEKERIKNEVIQANEEAYIQVGTFDESEGTRIVFWVNGQQVLDYLDTSDERITGGGYFGILEQTADRLIHLAPPIKITAQQEERETVFSDLSNHWSEKMVMELYDDGLVKGVSDGIFAPDMAVTRAEFIAMTVRALGLEETSGGSYFVDSNTDKWYNGALNAALESGLLDIEIIENNRIKPEQEITREEAAAIAAKACEVKLGGNVIIENISGFDDAQEVSEHFRDYFGITVAHQIIVGNENKLYPKQAVTRAEAAVMIHRLLQV